jgi:hypothetical protein
LDAYRFPRKGRQISLEECGTTFADKGIEKIKLTSISLKLF